MAKGVTVFGLRGSKSDPVWRLEASWWDESELRLDPRFSYESKVRGYDDYIAELSVEDARALAEKYRRKALPWQRKTAETLRERLDALSGQVSVVRVLVFEWGAGKSSGTNP